MQCALLLQVTLLDVYRGICIAGERQYNDARQKNTCPWWPKKKLHSTCIHWYGETRRTSDDGYIRTVEKKNLHAWWIILLCWIQVHAGMDIDAAAAAAYTIYIYVLLRTVRCAHRGRQAGGSKWLRRTNHGSSGSGRGIHQEQRWLLAGCGWAAGCHGFGHVPAGRPAFSSTDLQTKQDGKEQSRTVLVLSAIRVRQGLSGVRTETTVQGTHVHPDYSLHSIRLYAHSSLTFHSPT